MNKQDEFDGRAHIWGSVLLVALLSFGIFIVLMIAMVYNPELFDRLLRWIEPRRSLTQLKPYLIGWGVFTGALFIVDLIAAVRWWSFYFNKGVPLWLHRFSSVSNYDLTSLSKRLSERSGLHNGLGLGVTFKLIDKTSIAFDPTDPNYSPFDRAPSQPDWAFHGILRFQPGEANIALWVFADYYILGLAALLIFLSVVHSTAWLMLLILGAFGKMIANLALIRQMVRIISDELNH